MQFPLLVVPCPFTCRQCVKSKGSQQNTLLCCPIPFHLVCARGCVCVTGCACVVQLCCKYCQTCQRKHCSFGVMIIGFNHHVCVCICVTMMRNKLGRPGQLCGKDDSWYCFSLPCNTEVAKSAAGLKKAVMFYISSLYSLAKPVLIRTSLLQIIVPTSSKYTCRKSSDCSTSC